MGRGFFDEGLQFFKDSEVNFKHKTCYESLGKVYGAKSKGGSTRDEGGGGGGFQPSEPHLLIPMPLSCTFT